MKPMEKQKHLKSAVAWLAKIPVQDVFVDYMAMARQELRELDKLIQEENKPTEDAAKG